MPLAIFIIWKIIADLVQKKLWYYLYEGYYSAISKDENV